jgi:hypothetical protein
MGRTAIESALREAGVGGNLAIALAADLDDSGRVDAALVLVARAIEALAEGSVPDPRASRLDDAELAGFGLESVTSP